MNFLSFFWFVIFFIILISNIWIIKLETSFNSQLKEIKWIFTNKYLLNYTEFFTKEYYLITWN